MPGYLFDWTTRPNPTTNDPALTGKLTYGPHNHVTCDGVDVGGSVRRCLTGPGGWVEVVIVRPDGTPETEVYLVETGEVVPPDRVPEWNSKVPTPGGGWRDKYGERLKVTVLGGNVEYTRDPVPEPAGV